MTMLVQQENIVNPAVKLSLLVILCKSDLEIPVAFSIPLPRNTNLGAPFSAPANPFPGLLLLLPPEFQARHSKGQRLTYLSIC